MRGKWKGPASPIGGRKNPRYNISVAPNQGYVVKRGDSVSKLANKYGVSIRAIASKNKLADVDKLRIGQVLKIPRPKPRPKAKPSKVAGKSQSSADSSGSQGSTGSSGSQSSTGRSGYSSKRYHKISRGESLSQIAKQYGLSIEEIAQANDLEDIDTIIIGEKLLIP